MSRTFLVLIALVLGLLVVNRATTSTTRNESVATVPPAPSAEPSTKAATAPSSAQPNAIGAASAPVAAPALAPAPAVPTAQASRTPAIDLLVRLEAKRRLAGAAELYVDSLFSGPDSTVRRWADREGRPITVAVVLPGQGPPARLAALAWAGARQWEGYRLGVTFAESPDTSNADIVVRWIDRFDTDRTGQADTQMSGSGVIFSARITLALKDRVGRPLTDVQLGAIAIHEFGHALGLPHSGRPADIMFPVTTVTTPSDRDRQTALLLYSLPVGSLREPSS